MRILKILSQSRRDFEAEMVCEHCDNRQRLSGYDDAHYHTNVIPKIKCKACGETASADYRPNATKYGPEEVV
ncbi:hypothetical protein LCGC14_2798150 [marine sediment metagenome]|uniref:Uncharacterized protein n=1 Tax=marine sediment metagenome TaxID=412755 RepID=A0A0F9BEW3_9ZZZZ